MMNTFLPRFKFTPVAALLVGALQVVAIGEMSAAPLQMGDIVIATQAGGSVYQVDPVTGDTTHITTGGLLFAPSHVLVDRQGQIFTAERGGRIVKIDPATGAQTLVADGPLFSKPVALDFAGPNRMVVGNYDFFEGGKLIDVDLSTGSSSLLTSLSNLSNVQDVDVDHLGRVIVLDMGHYNFGGGQIVRFDPSTDQQTTVSTGGLMFNPSDLLIHPSGNYLVANRINNFTTQILQIDPITGNQQVKLTVPYEGWIALEDENTIVYASFFPLQPVLRANLLTGETEVVSHTNVSYNIIGVAVFSPIPEPTAVMLVMSGGLFLALGRSRSCRR